MAKFEIPKAVAQIFVLKLNGNIEHELYSSELDFAQALVRANLSNKRGTMKELCELSDEDGIKTAWIKINKKNEEAEE